MKTNPPDPDGWKSFTLVELLVVVAIISVLLALLMPALKNAQGSAKMITCASNLRQLSVASGLYVAENNGFYAMADLGSGNGGSDGRWWSGRLRPYIGTNAVFRCPAFKPRPVLPWPPNNFTDGVPFLQNVTNSAITTYSWNGNLGNISTFISAKHIATIRTPGGKVLLCDGVYRDNYAAWAINENGWPVGDIWYATSEGYINNVTTAFSPFLSRHPGKKNNLLFFDGHVESLATNKILGAWWTIP